MPNLPIKLLRPDAKLPTRATDGSAGYDLCAVLDAPCTLAPGDHAVIGTGIAIALPSSDCAAFVFARSGLATKHGIAPANAVGVIDSDYRGEIRVGLVNHYDAPYTITPGERIAQLLFLPVLLPALVPVDSLPETERGSGGFGSTGS
ncbi:MAG: dUTP diphosphatase [Oscillospiraceae bacterium]|jgi:dUTP pyrophosphatase|nr:dUTP diphosphatase [Oscillospiraceae bacterium]